MLEGCHKVSTLLDLSSESSSTHAWAHVQMLWSHTAGLPLPCSAQGTSLAGTKWARPGPAQGDLPDWARETMYPRRKTPVESSSSQASQNPEQVW